MADALTELAVALDQQVFQRIHLTEPTIFLVGAARSASVSLRGRIRQELAGKPRVPGFDVYYPEELFEEMLGGGDRGADLLQLENLLAESVHAVVIVLESEGAIAELGAFANHDKLKDRLVVVVDKKYRREKSFIMLGPVNYLRRRTHSEIILHPFHQPDFGRLGKDIRAAVRRVSKTVTVDTSVRNPVTAQHYLRAAIHVLNPVSQIQLKSLIERAGARSPEESDRIVATSLAILQRQREVALAGEAYILTPAGQNRLERMLLFENEGAIMASALDKARIRVLTWRLRRKQTLPI
jgi:hypothetical protein